MTGLLLLTEGGLGACLMEPPASFHPMAGTAQCWIQYYNLEHGDLEEYA